MIKNYFKMALLQKPKVLTTFCRSGGITNINLNIND